MRIPSAPRVITLWLCCAWLMPSRGRADVCDPNGQLQAPVVRVLNTMAKRLGVAAPTPWTLPLASAFAQAHLARPTGQERLSGATVAGYATRFGALGPSEKDAVQADLAQAGFCDAVIPTRSSFDFVLINGSTAPAVRRRIHAVAQAVDDKIIVLTQNTQIVFLDGERTRFASETPAVLCDPSPYPREPSWTPPAALPTDERGIDEMLWQQMRLPAVLRQQPILFVHAQKREGVARAHTADCVQAWVRRHHPHDANALVVSDNPFVEYQRRVTQVLLHQSGARGMHVSALGPSADLHAHLPTTRVGLLLDALAGTLYRACQQQQLGILDNQTD